MGATSRAATAGTTVPLTAPLSPVDTLAPPPAPAQQTAQEELLRQQLLEAIRVHESGDYEEAERRYRALMPAAGLMPRIELNLGILLRQRGKFDASFVHLKRVYAARPESANVVSALANTLRELNRIDDALRLHRRAVEMAPDQALLHYNLGCALWDHGDCEGALRAYDTAETFGPASNQLKVARAQALLSIGRWEEGYRAYAARWDLLPHKHRHRALPAWDGGRLDGRTLLVWAEQGMGDSIHFSRYFSLLRDLGGEIVFEVDEPLVDLMRAAPFLAGVTVVPMGEPVPQAQAQVPLMDLPLFTRVDPAEWRMPCPYLVIPPDQKYPRPLPPGLNVGLAWAGKPTNENDHKRSMSLRDMLPILDLPGVTFHSIQKGHKADEPVELGLVSLVRGMGLTRNNFLETAAAVDALDLIVTIDSSVGHLAGALGKPVFDLLAYCPDWRWGFKADTTPWYPSMRLFRQTRPGHWLEPMLAVREAIHKMAQAKAGA